MPNKDRKILICKPVFSPGYVVPGGVIDKCFKCGNPVWISPSSWLLYHDNPEMIFECIPCAAADIEKEGGEFETELTPAQIDEIKEYIRRSYGGRS